jgi:acetyltransferase-like isoleucine patch superfamily enzyme
MIKKLIPAFVKLFFLKRIAAYQKNVQFRKGVLINKYTVFEGNNVIYNHAEVTNSFIGTGTYVARGSVIRNADVGRFCAIGENVRTSLGLHPSKDFVSIHPAFFSVMEQAGFTFVDRQLFQEHQYVDGAGKYVCRIGNDVWIGNNVMIMDGITIGDGAIIAGGAIVTKNVDPYTIVGGIPAKTIKKRFTDEQIKSLLEIQWWNWPFDKIKNLAVNFVSVDEFILNCGTLTDI